MAKEHVRCVVVGDGAVGKTSMLISYCTDKFPTEYVPTVFDHFETKLMIGDRQVNLSLWDTAGQEAFDRLRPLSYPDTDVFIVCYSIISPSSLENVAAKWLPEIRFHCPDTPFVLVGTKCDLRTDKHEQDRLRAKGLVCDLIDPARASEEGEKNGASKVSECSARTQKGLKSVIVEAVQVALASRTSRKTRRVCAIL